jgi:hypothetical protein
VHVPRFAIPGLIPFDAYLLSKRHYNGSTHEHVSKFIRLFTGVNFF